MQKTIYINSVSGNIKAPASKSCLQRALAISLLTEGASELRGISFCDDVNAALSMIKDLGAEVSISGDTIFVQGTGTPKPEGRILNCGESGLASRLFIPLASLFNEEITIEGHGSLLTRKMDDFSGPLRNLGVSFRSENGFLPVRVRGPLKHGRAIVNGKMSSQFLSGLLIALPVTGGKSILDVIDLASKPYIDITIEIMRLAGVNVTHNQYREFVIEAGQTYRPLRYEVEGDWSGASVFLAMGAISGSLTIDGLRADSFQADRVVLDVLAGCGAKVIINKNSVRVSSSLLKPFVFDASDAPDLVPALAVLALACSGRSEIHNIERLRVKESDRVMSVTQLITAIGGSVEEKDNTLIITGGRKLPGGVVDACNDHRIVMAAAASSLLCEQPVTVKGVESVNKSYPQFIDHLVSLGADVK